MSKVKWGIWATGDICHDFAKSMEQAQNGEVVAVLSRSEENAKKFAGEFGIPKYYADAEAFLNDQEIDVVYVGTPSGYHHDNVLQCCRAGKNVLCEKPAGVNAQEVEEMVAAAQAADVFFMEGVWTHFFPAVLKAREWIDTGKIGRVKRVNVEFNIKAIPSGWRLKAPEGGGALLDVGIYCLTICSFAFGLKPSLTKSIALMENGVDTAESVIMQYEPDQIASFSCAFDCKNDHVAVISGDAGYITIDDKFWRPSSAKLFQYDDDPRDSSLVDSYDQQFVSKGFQFEAEHVGRCILEGKKQSDLIPWQKSLDLSNLMDALRSEWGK